MSSLLRPYDYVWVVKTVNTVVAVAVYCFTSTSKECCLVCTRCLRMATKLLKLSTEDKRQVKEEGVHSRLASLANEEAVEDLYSHLRTVEKENARLRNKVQGLSWEKKVQ